MMVLRHIFSVVTAIFNFTHGSKIVREFFIAAILLSCYNRYGYTSTLRVFVFYTEKSGVLRERLLAALAPK